MIRGWIARKKFRVYQINALSTNRYFKAEEAQETLTGKFNPDAPTETRTHSYATDAVYEGEWKGGMRHGKGKMAWADGGRYEGEWQYNQACGEGTFHHTSGDVYIGRWVNNKSNGFGVYRTVNGARYEGGWKDDL